MNVDESHPWIIHERRIVKEVETLHMCDQSKINASELFLEAMLHMVPKCDAGIARLMLQIRVYSCNEMQSC